MEASCTFAVFAVQKAVILIGEEAGRLRLSWEFYSGGSHFPRRDFSHCLARKSGASSFVGLAATAKPQWFAAVDCVCSKLANLAGFFILTFPWRR